MPADSLVVRVFLEGSRRTVMSGRTLPELKSQHAKSKAIVIEFPFLRVSDI